MKRKQRDELIKNRGPKPKQNSKNQKEIIADGGHLTKKGKAELDAQKSKSSENWDGGGRFARNDGPQRSSGGGNVDKKTFKQSGGSAPGGGPTTGPRKATNRRKRMIKEKSTSRKVKAVGLKVGRVVGRNKGKIALGAALGAGYAYKKNQEGKTVKGRIKKAYKKVKDKMN